MSVEMMKAMRQAISDVMNKMFFLPVQVNEKGLALREWFSNKLPLVGATINFTGSSSGYSYLLIPAGVAREMTANFLGIAEKGIDVKQERDTVKEALNMITGHMLSQFDRKGDLRIGIPQLINESDLSAGQLDGFNKGAILIETEHSHIAAGIVIKKTG
ncbi:MAG: chemotaxis protein CheX [Desulfobacterales bacterium]|nr:chemotaxis protein CheX [Desulfobacterales bacterium]